MKKLYLLPLLFLTTLYADPVHQEDKEVISVEEVAKSDEELAESGSNSSPNPKSNVAPTNPKTNKEPTGDEKRVETERRRAERRIRSR